MDVSVPFTLFSLLALVSTKEKAIEFLQSYGILLKERTCECGTPMKLMLGSRDRFRCKTKSCSKEKSLKADSWIEDCHLMYTQIIGFIYCWSKQLTTVRFCEEEMGISKKNSIDFNNLLREVCAFKRLSEPMQIGGQGKTVEIDETLITRRKYNVGRLKKQVWVFGGICREDNQCFLYVVENRTAGIAKKNEKRIENISFLNSKSSTMAEGTIPMKELSAIVLGMKLWRENLKEMDKKVQNIKIYTDSQVVLHWIFKNPQKKVYIKNRVESILRSKEEIEKNGTKITFHYIKTEVNPADIPTRGCTVDHEKFRSWAEGPVWMKDVTQYNENIKSIDDVVNKDKESEIKIINLFITEKRDNSYENIEKLIEKYSSFPKIIGIVKTMLKFISKSSEVRADTESEILKKFRETENEATRNKIAEKYMIKLHQEQNINCLSKKKYKCLDIVKDSFGIMRVRGRIQDDSADNEKCPILLFGNTNYTKLFLNYMHSVLLHANRDTMISIIRKEFCIIEMKSVINTIITKCVKCQKMNNRPYKCPNFPALRKRGRKYIYKPFENIGVDYAGPLYVQETEKGKQQKVWLINLSYYSYIPLSYHGTERIFFSHSDFIPCLG